jgi:hypothetical protein
VVLAVATAEPKEKKLLGVVRVLRITGCVWVFFEGVATAEPPSFLGSCGCYGAVEATVGAGSVERPRGWVGLKRRVWWGRWRIGGNRLHPPYPPCFWGLDVDSPCLKVTAIMSQTCLSCSASMPSTRVLSRLT